MKFPLYKQVALLKDYPEQGLTADDIVTTVDFLESPEVGIPNGYFVEAFNALGKTIAVFIVHEDDIEALTEHDVLSKRTIRATEEYELLPSKIQVFSEDNVTSQNLAPVRISQSDTVIIELSDGILKQKGLTVDEAKLHLAIVLFQQDFFSIGKASEFAGIHPSQFQKELANRQLSVHYDVDEYQQDIDTLNSHKDSSPVYHDI